MMGWFRGNTAPVPVQLAPQSVTDRYRAHLDTLAAASRQASAVISPAAFSTLRRIDDRMRPLIDDLEGRDILPEHEVAIDHFIATFVPDTLNLFLGLPAADQRHGGRGDTMLCEQLLALEQRARDFGDTMRTDALQAMTTNGFFLEQALR
ncbi:hypothetical protein [Curtobacterium sp. MCSS17_016]|uniref:hypothetical protein n=1 Tax=Curtobacterium sp. MCSS17_016 TaxID=2175644 RepID=UPI0011B7D65F|nr:hypothetical protein [Curtobacterium sp. MCSS17_016]WIE81115.1 hypothetical protein DEJ19_021810 [Curtobacterium sp. MCSS17_016]